MKNKDIYHNVIDYIAKKYDGSDAYNYILQIAEEEFRHVILDKFFDNYLEFINKAFNLNADFKDIGDYYDKTEYSEEYFNAESKFISIYIEANMFEGYASWGQIILPEEVLDLYAGKGWENKLTYLSNNTPAEEVFEAFLDLGNDNLDDCIIDYAIKKLENL